MDSISGKNAVGQVMLIAKSSQEGLKDGWTRATFILRKDHLEKIKALSYWKRRNIKEVLDEILEGYLKGKRIKLLRSESKSLSSGNH